MTRRSSRDVFRLDVGLRIRMWMALALNAALLVALLALAGWLFTTGDWPFVFIFLGFAVAGALSAQRRAGRRPGRDPERSDHIRFQVSRLCVIADIAEPEIELVLDDTPLTWTTALPGRTPRVHVTTGLATLLPDTELEAALAHELSHIGNRDAVLMTLLAAPGVFVLRGFRAALRDKNAGLSAKAGIVLFAAFMGPPALLSAVLSRVVSRHREFAADRGAAVLTGSPAALASALRRVSAGLHAIPDRDLRLAATTDVFHIVPARPPTEIGELWATHPPLADRIRRLERLEARLQA